MCLEHISVRNKDEGMGILSVSLCSTVLGLDFYTITPPPMQLTLWSDLKSEKYATSLCLPMSK